MVEEKIGKFNLEELAIVTVAKPVLERFLAPVVGNGTLQSGLIKLVGAYFVGSNLKGNIGKGIATALAVDGGEDIALSLLSGGLGLRPANTIEDAI